MSLEPEWLHLIEVVQLDIKIEDLQAEIERLRSERLAFATESEERKADNERLLAAAKAFEEGLSSDCDGPERDALRAALKETKP